MENTAKRGKAGKAAIGHRNLDVGEFTIKGSQ